jgi:hypothetical protein
VPQAGVLTEVRPNPPAVHTLAVSSPQKVWRRDFELRDHVELETGQAPLMKLMEPVPNSEHVFGWVLYRQALFG